MDDVVPRAWSQEKSRFSHRRRNLLGACLAHLVHDGYTNQTYALLPVWQSEFGLSYAGLALVSALFSGTMAVLQVPADKFTARFTPRLALSMATLVSASGLFIAALPLGIYGLCAGLILAGVGSSVQHPRAAHLVNESFAAARGPLGIYNFAGDLGKALFPASVAALLPILAWRPVLGMTASVGIIAGIAILFLLPKESEEFAATKTGHVESGAGRGLGLLMMIGAFDTATRMGYLIFLPFLLRAHGGHESTIGVGLALLFLGGALGKACCGWLGERLGVVWCVITTEALTAFLMLITLILPLALTIGVLPFLGIVLNGTSSVIYGTVPELSRKNEISRSFARFYTVVIGAGVFAPIVYGTIADHSSKVSGIIASALTAAAIIPMVLTLRPFLREERFNSL